MSPRKDGGPASNEPTPRPFSDRSRRTVARSAVGSSQLRSLPGESFEDIFTAQVVDEPAAEQPSSETTRKIAKREGRCRYCGETVFWSVTEKNHKPIPLDPEPSNDPRCGNFILISIGGETLARYVSDARRFEFIAAGHHVWIAHAASCSRRRAA